MKVETFHCPNCGHEVSIAQGRFGPVLRLIERAENVVASDADWVTKYDTVFGMKIPEAMREAHVELDDLYCDPDTTYEADVRAYVEALTRLRERLLKLLPTEFGLG